MKNASLNWIRLPLVGVENCRELGGYNTIHGEQTRWHTFIRSSDLSEITEEDKNFLINYGVKTVIDLRSADEANQYPNPLANEDNIHYINIPLLNSDVANLIFSDSNFTLGKMYIDLLQNEDGIKKVFQSIVKADGCVLYHCSAGKDRTGIISMLLLALAGVQKQDIISNYEVTYTNIEKLREKFKAYSLPNEEFLLSKPESIIEAYNYICERFGNAENYLLKIGITENEIDTIRNRFILK